MPNTPEQAIAAALHQSNHGPRFGEGQCQMRCRLAYGVASDGTPDATQGWFRSRYKHATTDASKIPRGALVYWTGGSAGHGHVAISLGGGKCISTDALRSGYFDAIDIDWFRTHWPKDKLMGWTEDIDGVRVFVPPAPKPVPAAPKTRGTHVDAALRELNAATGHKTKVAAAKAILRSIPEK